MQLGCGERSLRVLRFASPFHLAPVSARPSAVPLLCSFRLPIDSRFRMDEASLEFVQSKAAFWRNSLPSLDFIQSGGTFLEILSEIPAFRWIKSTLDQRRPRFPLRRADKIQPRLPLPTIEASSAADCTPNLSHIVQTLDWRFRPISQLRHCRIG